MMKNKENKKKRKVTEKLKRNKGITLIALVITIIVLLILAGVTIATLAGDNGILTNATEAKEETRYATIKEEKDLWELSKLADEKTDSSTAETREEVINRLYENGTITENERDTLLAGDAITVANKEISFGTTLVEMFKQAQAEGCTGGSCSNTNHLHIGDYLNYTPSNSSATTEPLEVEDTGYSTEQTYTVNADTKWRVLGLNEAGDQILLTTETPIQKDGSDPYLVLQGVEGYMNCESTLNKICSIYANTDLATEVRSMTADDINYALGVELDKEKNTIHKIGDTTPLEDYTGWFGKKYSYKGQDYAPENYMNDKYKTSSYEEKSVGDAAEGSAYNYSYDIVDTSSTNPTLYNLLFDGTTSEDRYAKSYWLASPGVEVLSSNAYFGPGAVDDGQVRSGYDLFDSYGGWGADRLAVRPVVSLRSGVTLSEIGGKGSASTTDIWAEYENNNPNIDSGYLEGNDGLISSPE